MRSINSRACERDIGLVGGSGLSTPWRLVTYHSDAVRGASKSGKVGLASPTQLIYTPTDIVLNYFVKLEFHLKDKPAGYLGSAIVGITFGAAWIPCVGPILGAILTLAATSSEIGTGIFYLGTYATGLAVPFFLSAVAVNSFFEFPRKLRRYLRAIHLTAGILLIIVGVLLITDYMSVLNIYALRFTPEWLIKRL